MDRQSENESIIVDTRLSALETNMMNAWTWKVFAFILAGVLTLDAVVSFASYRVSESKVTCRDEVKVTSSERQKMNETGVTTVGVACTHSRQTGKIVSATEGVITFTCTCH
jgi:hypothetical protein